MSKLYDFEVKLDKWASPTVLQADSALNAVKLAEKLYPTCDCCDDKAVVTSVRYI